MTKFYYFLRVLQIIAPWIWGAVISIIRLMLISLAAFWKGLFEAVDAVASEMLEQAMQSGNVPPIWSEWLFWVFRVIAFLTILVGWILIARFTIWLTHLLPFINR